MATQLKIRRGTTAEHASFTGAEGEITLDTTKDTLVAHDNYTAGGRPMLREDLANLGAGRAGKTVQVQKSIYAVRTTLPTTTSTYWVWTPFSTGNYFVKQKTDTHLRVQAYLPGAQKHSYPGFFMKMKMTNPSGGTNETYEGCRYYHGGYYSNNDVHGEYDRIWSPSELGNAAGNFMCDLGWHSTDGSAIRPFNVWNPNTSDDARGGQQVSYCYITEFYV